ncbi:cyclopropane-fatty-acyl-phospholipid synthase family protein [Variovorax sp. OV329]|uniref:SAM-dependent methyltransferase n=1 Tax=Variovorax sp. OV329 TaxID=1882825 RepID=UPI0008ED9A12|nr:cyclopropane-fatty-acyl-phospholipid synthase family protein [Variovorax sp. OV329]SFN41523.1 cyclopropane-fatty-acyl-phospholipid synthase [Variovorax sp. OV329]
MNTTSSLQSSATPSTWHLPGIAWLARRQLQQLLARLQCGSLRVELPDGQVISQRGRIEGPQATLQLHRWRVLRRLLAHGDLGLAESYADGDWSTPDLTALLDLGLRNEAAWGARLDGSRLARLAARVRHRLNANTRSGSRRNIAAHYDLGNDFYAAWLDPRLIYSSALYAPGDATLEAAQVRKLARIARLLALQPGQQVLEIGCGWGALAVDLAREQGVQVTGLTLSQRQLEHAQAEVARAGMQASVQLRLQDYREVQGRFDRIVSIEMLEAVGEAYWPRYFDTLRERLSPDGCAVLQVILIDDASFAGYRRGADFIQRHIFPGGMLPSNAALREQAARAGLRIECTDRFGASYARTLVEWRERFEAAWPQLQAQGFDEAFRRLWRYYLCYCEAGFRAGRVDVGLYRLRHAARTGD